MTTLFSLLMLLPLSGSAGQRQSTEEFRDFCNKFYSDSTFREERVKYPMMSLSLKDPAGPVDTVYLQQGQWQYPGFSYLVNTYNVQIYDNFKKRLRSSSERVVSFEGVDNGINFSFYFQRIEGRWYLVKQEDLDGTLASTTTRLRPR